MRNDVGTENLPGEDWRSKAEAKGERHTEDPVAIALERARERGRGREAGAPEAIPPLGWRDILWRVLKGIIEDRILYTSGRRCVLYATRLLPRCRDHSLHIWSCG